MLLLLGIPPLPHFLIFYIGPVCLVAAVTLQTLLRPGWRQVVVQWSTNSCICLHLEFGVVHLRPNPFIWCFTASATPFRESYWFKEHS